MQDFFEILSNFGFPIALSVYLLVRFENILAGLQQTIRDLVQKNTDLLDEIAALKNIIGELKDRLISRRGK